MHGWTGLIPDQPEPFVEDEARFVVNGNNSRLRSEYRNIGGRVIFSH